jgi:hypothetical protein
MMQNMKLSVKMHKGKNTEHKHQTEIAVDWKCLFATVNNDVKIASICFTIYRLGTVHTQSA